MKHTQLALPYAYDALVPILSKESMEYHYDKHHATYYTKLNTLIEASTDEALHAMPLVDIVKNAAPGALFNNAGQAWNHDFYWQCLTPDSDKQTLPIALETVIEASFGSIDLFKEQFINAAIAQFGSGWAWLVKDSEGTLSIETTSNADTPLKTGKTCLLTCDVWEHAYYIDYRNLRPDYLHAFWDIVNWQFVHDNFQAPSSINNQLQY